MFRAGIIGVTGYVGIEVIRLLQQHPHAKITQIMTKTYAGYDIDEVYPHLSGKVFLKCNEIDPNAILEDCDLVVIALPHGNSAQVVETLLAAGKRVIDLGADFRLKKPSDFLHWYKQASAPEPLLAKAVYGLPEITNKQTIAKAQLIANPGCMPTAVILASMPLFKAKIVELNECFYDVKTGMSGMGRTPKIGTQFCEMAENIQCFDPAGSHRHTPEIEQELSLIANTPITVQFTPYVLPIIRGILATCYFKLNKEISEQEIFTLFKRAYENEPFIRICPPNTIANVKNVRGSNYCDMSIHLDKRTQRVIVISAIDNLVKGAAGQAIQNLNLMYQLPETTGLDNIITLYP